MERWYFIYLNKIRAIYTDPSVQKLLIKPFYHAFLLQTVNDAVETCKKLNIPFPEINSEDKKKPNDFYVFEGKNSPTVIHIPLFNVVNCGGKFRSAVLNKSEISLK